VITFAESVVKDPETIRQWCAGQQVTAVAERLLRKIIFQGERLADFPENGRVAPEFEIMNLREIVYSPFRIVYRHHKNRVRIVLFWRSERLLKTP